MATNYSHPGLPTVTYRQPTQLIDATGHYQWDGNVWRLISNNAQQDHSYPHHPPPLMPPPHNQNYQNNSTYGYGIQPNDYANNGSFAFHPQQQHQFSGAPELTHIADQAMMPGSSARREALPLFPTMPERKQSPETRTHQINFHPSSSNAWASAGGVGGSAFVHSFAGNEASRTLANADHYAPRQGDRHPSQSRGGGGVHQWNGGTSPFIRGRPSPYTNGRSNSFSRARQGSGQNGTSNNDSRASPSRQQSSNRELQHFPPLK